jgi:hypothetical protein
MEGGEYVCLTYKEKKILIERHNNVSNAFRTFSFLDFWSSMKGKKTNVPKKL